jgi:type I restriction enzyme R subunit
MGCGSTQPSSTQATTTTRRTEGVPLDEKLEQIRKDFIKVGEWPKILIVTEKLLTGFDAPILYAMYLDKPMRDHTLLQAIARVNRPYENEAAEMVKPHGFVLDFVGIFDKLEKALALLNLIEQNFNDKDVDNLIDHFRDKRLRKELFKEYKELEMLYEIISPDAFLRPYMETYAHPLRIYDVVRAACAKRSTSIKRSTKD